MILVPKNIKPLWRPEGVIKQDSATIRVQGADGPIIHDPMSPPKGTGWLFAIHLNRPYKNVRHFMGFLTADGHSRLKSHRLIQCIEREGITGRLVYLLPMEEEEFHRIHRNATSMEMCYLCRRERMKRGRKKLTVLADQI